ncbi:MAG: hypothetical protein KKH68_04025, partial [Proteobacteria bacterium]|nr:hypothetical protein [Pseudomonadota bacterium]
MHLKRWITALVAVPCLVGLVSFGSPALFAGFIGAVCVLALREYYRIVFGNREKARQRAVTTVGYITGPGIIGAAFTGSAEIGL